MQNVIDILRMQVEKIGLPVHFKDDILIDAENIGYLHLNKFIWILRECGTEIYPLIAMPPRTKKAKLLWMQATIRSHPEARGFLFNRGEFKEINIRKAFRVDLDES